MGHSGWTRVALLGLIAALSGCATVPYTNRSQFIMMSESEDLALGADAVLESLLELGALFVVERQEAHAHAVLAGRRQVLAELSA